MDNQESDLQTLRTLVRDLVARVERLERSAETRATAASDPSLYAEIQPSEVPLTPSRPALSQVPATETPAMPPQANTLPAMPLAPPRFTPRDSGPQFAAAKPDIDLESRIGSHWLNRIGISAVLIGMSYFLKLAFDNNWIGPTGRVSIGLWRGSAPSFGAKVSASVVTTCFPTRSRQLGWESCISLCGPRSRSMR